MEGDLRGKGGRSAAVLVLLLALASAVCAICYANVTVYYADGSSQNCGTFCVFQGGWICKP